MRVCSIPGLAVSAALAMVSGCTDTDAGFELEGRAFELVYMASLTASGNRLVLATNSESPCVTPFPPAPEGQELVVLLVRDALQLGTSARSPAATIQLYGRPLRVYLAADGPADMVLLEPSATVSGLQVSAHLTFTERIGSTGEAVLTPPATLRVTHAEVTECPTGVSLEKRW
jgi:hypothetical protein